MVNANEDVDESRRVQHTRHRVWARRVRVCGWVWVAWCDDAAGDGRSRAAPCMAHDCVSVCLPLVKVALMRVLAAVRALCLYCLVAPGCMCAHTCLSGLVG